MSANKKNSERNHCFYCKECLDDEKTYPYSQLRKVLIDWNFESESGFTNRMLKGHKLEYEFYCLKHYNGGDPMQPGGLWHFSTAGSSCKSCDVYITKDGKKKQEEYNGPQYVRLSLPTSKSSEFVWATPISENEYVIKNIPFFSDSACFLDTVEVEDRGLDSIELHFVRVIRRKGNGTIHFCAHKPSIIKAIKELRAQKHFKFSLVNQFDKTYSLSISSRNWKTVSAFFDKNNTQGRLEIKKKIIPSLSI